MRVSVPIVLLTLLASAGCRRLEMRPADGPIVIAITTKPTSIDPAQATTQVCQDLARQQFQTLTAVDADGTTVGQLAASWNWAASRREITFKLKVAKFSDGTDIHPLDVKRSIERAASPSIASGEIETYLGDIDGADAFIKGRATEIAGISVNDSRRTVTFRLKTPVAGFVQKLSHPMCSIVRSTKQGLIGTGAYRLTHFVDGETYEFEPSTDNARHRLIFRVVEDASTRLNLAQAGKIDVCPISAPRRLRDSDS